MRGFKGSYINNCPRCPFRAVPGCPHWQGYDAGDFLSETRQGDNALRGTRQPELTPAIFLIDASGAKRPLNPKTLIVRGRDKHRNFPTGCFLMTFRQHPACSVSMREKKIRWWMRLFDPCTRPWCAFFTLEELGDACADTCVMLYWKLGAVRAWNSSNIKMMKTLQTTRALKSDGQSLLTNLIHNSLSLSTDSRPRPTPSRWRVGKASGTLADECREVGSQLTLMNVPVHCLFEEKGQFYRFEGLLLLHACSVRFVGKRFGRLLKNYFWRNRPNCRQTEMHWIINFQINCILKRIAELWASASA